MDYEPLCDEITSQIAQEALAAMKDGVGWEDFAKYKGIPLDEMEAILALYEIDTEDSVMMTLARTLIANDKY
ncbi:hypothetical protein SAMN02910317_01970 [Ruminococcaceae bacterium FB2012]|nr:hypothetical protein SAMN02910317_01970 [Ruminococcaceae bacterium FB2012]